MACTKIKNIILNYYIILTLCQLYLEAGLWTITVSFFGFIKLTNFNTSDLYMYKLLWLWKFKQSNSKAKPNFLSLSGQAAGTESLQTIAKTSSGLQLSTGWWSSSVSGCCHFGGHSDMYTVTVTATLCKIFWCNFLLTFLQSSSFFPMVYCCTTATFEGSVTCSACWVIFGTSV